MIYHCHPANIIALTFVLPLKEEVFTRELWEMMTECPVIFPDGIAVIPWMVPGGKEIAVESSRYIKNHDVIIWAHHGMFCSGKILTRPSDWPIRWKRRRRFYAKCLL